LCWGGGGRSLKKIHIEKIKKGVVYLKKKKNKECEEKAHTNYTTPKMQKGGNR
jgi:hypothetical protein